MSRTFVTSLRPFGVGVFLLNAGLLGLHLSVMCLFAAVTFIMFATAYTTDHGIVFSIFCFGASAILSLLCLVIVRVVFPYMLEALHGQAALAFLAETFGDPWMRKRGYMKCNDRYERVDDT